MRILNIRFLLLCSLIFSMYGCKKSFFEKNMPYVKVNINGIEYIDQLTHFLVPGATPTPIVRYTENSDSTYLFTLHSYYLRQKNQSNNEAEYDITIRMTNRRIELGKTYNINVNPIDFGIKTEEEYSKYIQENDIYFSIRNHSNYYNSFGRGTIILTDSTENRISGRFDIEAHSTKQIGNNVDRLKGEFSCFFKKFK